MATSSPVHACFRAQCGICGRALVAGVRFVPLISCNISSGSPPCLEGVVFPSGNTCNYDYHGTSLCWRQRCLQCKGASRAVGLHSDCFALFQRECAAENALDRLWVAVLSRSPWWFALDARIGKADFPLELIYEKAEKFGLPGWKVLPPELTQMIQDCSESASFWLYLSALSFIRDLTAVEDSPESDSLLSVPLSDVLEWTRGNAPVLLEDEDGPPIVRLTSDCRGLKRVERLSSRPSYQGWRSDTMEFGIQDLSQLKSVNAEFKYNILRLETPDSNHGLHIWDMPDPPLMEDCEFCGYIGQSIRFSTIDLQVATGLTFFFSHSKVYAVHMHTSSSPDATRTFQRFSALRQANVAWIYFPIPRGEEIISIGLRLKKMDSRAVSQMPCFLFRTKLAGDVILGPAHYRVRWQDVILAPSHPKLLIHCNNEYGPITVFGAYAPNRGDSAVTFSDIPPSDIPIRPALFSSAPLQFVTCIEVFENMETGVSTGILFHYENGAQRAVGSCRLGLDRVKTYLKPSRLCWHTTSERAPSMRVVDRFDSGDSPTHPHDDDNWACTALEGTMDFWFAPEESAILVHQP